jgi:hypothetical protein
MGKYQRQKKYLEVNMLLTQSVEEERNFVLSIIKEAGKKGERIDLDTLTARFVEKHNWGRRPGLFDAIRQLKAEGLIIMESPGGKVVVDFP